ncbi:MAG TPA: phosphate signaling complex protein PhoU [Thermomicrobiales bacterium]|nr:phosphate signaling complex protein PhoU [Thermomicrobiales bacterium]
MSSADRPNGRGRDRDLTRVAFHQQLDALRGDVVAMGSMVEKAIARATAALTQRDPAAARRVIAGDETINAQRWGIEDDAARLIAMQAPLAGDLRAIVAAIHIGTDLERMGDHAAGIAKLAIDIAGEPPVKPLVDLPRMADLTREMLGAGLAAYMDADADAARVVAARDDDVDDLYNQIYRELLTYMMADPTTIDPATRLLWVAHNYERLADRVTNICERVVYVATSRIEEINVSRR